MPTTPILGITQVSASQNNKEVTINDAIGALESATNAKLDVDFTSSNSILLSDSQFTGAFIFNAENATAAATLRIPTTINSAAVTRIFAVRNDSGHGLTVEFNGTPGTTVAIPDGETRLLSAFEGVDVIVAAEPATTVTFLSLTDSPSSFTGQVGRFLTVNSAENALEFADAAVFPSLATNAGKYLVVNSTSDGVEWVTLDVAATFLELTDTPAAYTGQGNKLVAVNGAADALVFVDPPEAEAVEFIAATRWRMFVIDFNPLESQVGVGELELLDLDGVNLASGGTATASHFVTGSEAAKAFDGNTTTGGNGWLTPESPTGDVWLEYEFTSAQTVRSFRITNIPSLPNFSPSRFLIQYWNGTAWVDLGDRTADTWVDLNAQTFKVNGVPLSSVTDAPEDGNFYARQDGAWAIPDIGNLGDVDTDSVAPTDGQILIWNQSNSAWEPGNLPASGSVFKARAASTANVSLASAVENGDPLDGVTLATNDRILLKDQTDPAENGVYVVQASGAPARADDASTGAALVNYAVFISEGSVNADKFFQCTTNAPITVGTTGLTFEEVTGGTTSVGAEDDGVSVVGAATVFNFTGAGVTVTDAGGGQANIAIPGGTTSAASETITEATTSANLADTNAGKYQRWTATGAKTLTVQPEATEAITQDAEFIVANRAASDNLTVAAGTGVTINVPSGGTLALAPGMVATLKRVAENVFDLIGQTVAA